MRAKFASYFSFVQFLTDSVVPARPSRAMRWVRAACVSPTVRARQDCFVTKRWETGRTTTRRTTSPMTSSTQSKVTTYVHTDTVRTRLVGSRSILHRSSWPMHDARRWAVIALVTQLQEGVRTYHCYVVVNYVYASLTHMPARR